MSVLSQRLQVGVAQKQVLTPGLVQLVTVLQLNRLELRDMISQEVAANPVLEESLDGLEELTPEELQSVLERERIADPADQAILEATGTMAEAETETYNSEAAAETPVVEAATAAEEKPVSTDPFDEIDFDNYFQEYLEPGYKSPAGETSEKPSWETFVSSPVTLPDYLQQQLSLMVLPDGIRDAADSIIGNLDENGYLTVSLEEIGTYGTHSPEEVGEALRAVQTLDPAGVAARDVRECLMLQVVSRNGKGGVAWQILDKHMKLLEMKQFKEIARILGRPLDHIQTALEVIRHLDPRPGLRYSGPGARVIEPDVYIVKDGESWLIELNDDDMPQLRLNRQYIAMLDREKEPSKEIRNYVKERFASASMLMKNIEQRKQTILKVCQNVVNRQGEFLEHGLDHLRPMMIKEIAEEIGVHPSTVSRAVAGKYAHTPQGVFELRFFFSEAVQGPSGGSTPLLLLKRMVKKMIDEEDTAKPLTDEQITAKLQTAGIDVTRRTVAKYREDLKIPSTHQRRVKN
jgi:RNA polymerase sigma-54 factor